MSGHLALLDTTARGHRVKFDPVVTTDGLALSVVSGRPDFQGGNADDFGYDGLKARVGPALDVVDGAGLDARIKSYVGKGLPLCLYSRFDPVPGPVFCVSHLVSL